MNTKIDPAKNPTVERHVRKFLHTLNSGGGKPLETLTPAEARQVLVSAQKGAILKVFLQECHLGDASPFVDWSCATLAQKACP